MDIKRIFVDDFYVIVYYYFRWWEGDVGNYVIDIYWVKDGKVVEYWESVMDVVLEFELKYKNGQFQYLIIDQKFDFNWNIVLKDLSLNLGWFDCFIVCLQFREGLRLIRVLIIFEMKCMLFICLLDFYIEGIL